MTCLNTLISETSICFICRITVLSYLVYVFHMLPDSVAIQAMHYVMLCSHTFCLNLGSWSCTVRPMRVTDLMQHFHLKA